MNIVVLLNLSIFFSFIALAFVIKKIVSIIIFRKLEIAYLKSLEEDGFAATVMKDTPQLFKQFKEIKNYKKKENLK